MQQLQFTPEQQFLGVQAVLGGCPRDAQRGGFFEVHRGCADDGAAVERGGDLEEGGVS